VKQQSACSHTGRSCLQSGSTPTPLLVRAQAHRLDSCSKCLSGLQTRCLTASTEATTYQQQQCDQKQHQQHCALNSSSRHSTALVLLQHTDFAVQQ
jgi:hypothetical protein